MAKFVFAKDAEVEVTYERDGFWKLTVETVLGNEAIGYLTDAAVVSLLERKEDVTMDSTGAVPI